MMGIFGAIAEGVVAIRYDVDAEKAKAEVQGLSREQKKAAREAAAEYEKEAKAFKAKVQEFAKGAAVIGATIAVAKTGLTAFREESKLMAGSAGVDIDRLSDAWGGLKTRMDVLTLAQAGHQGAWKLTTGQLEQVTEGMRALEKKGFDSQQVFEKFTDVIKKGKLEGLDDFGLSLQATGDQSKDLQVLMRALGSEVADVGGNFDKAGDAATRAGTRMEDAIGRARSNVGKALVAITEGIESTSRAFAAMIYGPLPEDNGPGARAGIYAAQLAARRNGGVQISGSRSRGTFAKATGADSWFTFADRQLFAGPTGADQAAGKMLATFQGNVRRAMQGMGPLATKTPEEFAAIMNGLPQDWRLVDEDLAKRADALSVKLEERFQKVGAEAASGIVAGFRNAFRKNAAETKARSKGGGRGKAKDVGPGLIFGAVDWIGGAVDGLAGLEDQRAAERAAREAATNEATALRSDFYARARGSEAEAAALAAAAKAEKSASEQSFLERTFGKLEEFDAYAAAFGTLKGAVLDGFSAWIDGTESLGEAVKRSIAGSLKAYAIEMAGKALVAGAEGLFYLASGNLPQAAAMGASAAKYTAAAAALGVLAKSVGGSSGGSSGVANSAAGVGSSRPSERPNQSSVVVVGDPLADDSARERARRVRRTMAAAGRNNEGVRYG